MTAALSAIQREHLEALHGSFRFHDETDDRRSWIDWALREGLLSLGPTRRWLTPVGRAAIAAAPKDSETRLKLENARRVARSSVAHIEALTGKGRK